MIKKYGFLGWLSIAYSAADGFSFRLGAEGRVRNTRLPAQSVDEIAGRLQDGAGVGANRTADDGPADR